MDIILALSGMWTAFGVVSGFLYQVKRRLVLGGIIASCVAYGSSVLAGVSFTFLKDWMNALLQWIKTLGWGGLGYPLGFIVGERFGRSWTG